MSAVDWSKLSTADVLASLRSAPAIAGPWEDSNTVTNFWIDMESGVRTADLFDLAKVEEVLSICDGLVSR